MSWGEEHGRGRTREVYGKNGINHLDAMDLSRSRVH